MIYIDIGSFSGEEARQAVREGYTVHCFEPNPALWPEIPAGVILNRAAAWDRDGVAELYLRAPGDTSDMGVSLIKEKTNINKNDFITVPTINTGRYLHALDQDIAIIKIDAEGAEYRIIASILDHFDPTRITQWYVEDHAARIDSPAWQAHRAQVLQRVTFKIDLW